MPPQQKPAAAAVEEPAAAEAAGTEAAVAGSGVGPAPTSLKKRPELERCASAGLVSNDSLKEEEVEHFFAPEGAVEEEERLRKEREERQAHADPPAEVCSRVPVQLCTLLTAAVGMAACCVVY